MVRTNHVELKSIPGFAYRQKLTSGGSGIVIVRYGKQPGIASISKTSGKPIITANTPKDLYPEEAFVEAMELTVGLPYRRLGDLKLKSKAEVEPDVSNDGHEDDALQEFEVTIDLAEYQKIIDKYTDKNGKFSYELLNKDLIQLGHSSRHIQTMVDEKASVNDIVVRIMKTRLIDLTGNNSLTDDQVEKIIVLLDEIDERGILRPLKDEVRKWLSKSKRK